jgi:type II secretory pathway component PulJ
MRIFRPGNDEGYALLDAILAIFLASLLAGVIATGIGTTLRLSSRMYTQAKSIVEERNQTTLQELSKGTR